MSRKGSDFAGLSVAIVTPFKDGKLDVVRLKEQIEFQIEAGRRLAEEQRKAVILISSDMPEIIKLANRILVFRDSHIVGEVDDVDNPEKGYKEISHAIGEYLR